MLEIVLKFYVLTKVLVLSAVVNSKGNSASTLLSNILIA